MSEQLIINYHLLSSVTCPSGHVLNSLRDTKTEKDESFLEALMKKEGLLMIGQLGQIKINESFIGGLDISSKEDLKNDEYLVIDDDFLEFSNKI